MRHRSVPQHIQQQVIRAYCEKNDLKFLLSATEFLDNTMMLEAIKEDVIVMYSIHQWPYGWETGKEVHFAAENCTYNKETAETIRIMEIYDNHRGQLSSIAAQLNQA